MRTPLPPDAIALALRDLPGWVHEQDQLRKSFRFGSFPEALSFMVRIGFAAEKLNHHPELRNMYALVEVALCTHDADNRVTEMDLRLAGAIENISWI